MKKILLLFIISFFLFFSKESIGQGNYFATGIGTGGTASSVTLRDVEVDGSVSQTGYTGGHFLIQQYSVMLPMGTASEMLADYGYYPYDPPSLYSPVILRSVPVASTSYISLDNSSSSSKTITVRQYYTTALIYTETFTLPGSVLAYKYYLKDNAQKTFNSRAAIIGLGGFPTPIPDQATYFIQVLAN